MTKCALKRWCVAVSVLILMQSPGCGGRNFGETVTVAPAQRHRVTEQLQNASVLSIPNDAAFAVTETSRMSSGSGRADSTAEANGTAGCVVSANADGTAESQFQLGYAIENDSDQNYTVTIKPRIEFSHEWVVDAEAEGEDDALALKFVINDSEGVTHARIMLAEKENRFGPPRLTAQQNPEVDVILEPHKSYQILLVGRVVLSRSPLAKAQSRRIALNVSRFVIDIERSQE